MAGLGSSIGPSLSGALAHPAEKLPKLFGSSDLLRRYPYLLSTLSSAAFTAVAVTVGALFLRETLPARERARRMSMASEAEEPLLESPGSPRAFKQDGVSAPAQPRTPWRQLLTPGVCQCDGLAIEG